jgi:preprotein translocase subunit SecF
VALLVGLIAGVYSSLFVATPVLVWLEERRPQYREIRERVERRGADAESLVDRPSAPAGAATAAAAAAGSAGRRVVASSSSAAGASAAGRGDVRLSDNIPARPRKQKRR